MICTSDGVVEAGELVRIMKHIFVTASREARPAHHVSLLQILRHGTLQGYESADAVDGKVVTIWRLL